MTLVERNEQYRLLPSVEEVVSSLENLEPGFPRALIVAEARAVLDDARDAIGRGQAAPQGIATLVKDNLKALATPSLRRVLNATGVILHTNLGRAPLPEFEPPPPYSNLEHDLATGKRGKRDVHTAELLVRLLGASAIVVNNGAAAVFLALHELAAGEEVIVSRGELIEIGDGFRIPDIMHRSGARLVEVGTTNKTRLEDYRDAITAHTRVILRVHPSNFRITGFAGRPPLADLCRLGRERGIPVYEDLGSGCLVDLSRYGIDEPLAQASLAAGVDLVSFSGDKLLGGPQAGIIAGRSDLVARLRRNPMFRALRLDKLSIAALEPALRHILLEEWDALPVMRMLRQSKVELKARSEALIETAHLVNAQLMEGSSLLGGGSTPDQAIPTWLIALPGDAVEWERRLRKHDPPILARIENDRLLLDLRTIAPEEEWHLIGALKQP